MGILASMMTGVTGLQAQGEALSIYGDNIANSNTTGFKVSRPEFQDVVAKSLKGLLGGNQIGRGTRMAAVNPIFSQGSLVQTESPSDLGISGDGFFVIDGIDGRSFSRNGAFHFDNEGALINSDNYRVLGFKADADGKLTSKLMPITIDQSVVDARPTNEVSLFMNLDFRADPALKFDPEKPDKTAHFATGVTVFDSAGTAHVVTAFFNKLEGEGEWEYRIMAKGDEVVDGVKGKMSQQGSGKLKFGSNGRLDAHEIEDDTFDFNKGAKLEQKVEFNFGKTTEQGGAGIEVTQYGTDSEAYKTIQNGYTAGSLTGLTFGDDGVLSAQYSNGENVNLSQVALGKFENPEGLFKMGQNRFRESRLSGTPTIGAPKTGGRGTISPKTIELSTTDVASEFINLMQAQRNFEANSRVIKTADQMMAEVLSIRQ